jgi:hypothetical protein
MTAENRSGVADLLVIFGITGDLVRKRLTRMRATRDPAAKTCSRLSRGRMSRRHHNLDRAHDRACTGTL